MNSLKINMFTRNAYFQYSHRAVSVITAFTLVFSTFAFAIPQTANAVALPMCNGSTATIYVSGGFVVGGTNNGAAYIAGTTVLLGTNAANDIIVGTTDGDLINAGNGINKICALDGNDNITSGSGADWIDAGEGDNIIDAGNGDNTITTADGDNQIDSGAGEDVIVAGEGDNIIDAGNGDNTITTGNGDNTITAGSGEDDVTTGAGDDHLSLGNGDNTADAGAGNDTIIGGSGDDEFDGGPGYDLCYPANGDNEVINCELTGASQGIFIVKEASPEGDTGFEFTGELDDFTLVDDGSGDNYQAFGLSVGGYTVTESESEDWTLESLSCNDTDGGTTVNLEDMQAVIDLDAGQSIVCTFSNEEFVSEPEGDEIAPDMPVHVSPADGSTLTSAELTEIQWTDVTDPSSPVVYYYQSSLSPATNIDGSFVSPAYSSGALSASEIPTAGTPEGTYYWHVRAEDSEGNSSPWTSAWSVTVDNTPEPVCDAQDILVSDSLTYVDGYNAVAITVHPSWAVLAGATWIWDTEIDGTSSHPEGEKTFARTFSIDGAPSGDATLKISSDNGYTVYVNGTLVGSDADDQNWSTVDTVNVPSALLLSGENVITITVDNYPRPEGYFGPNPAGLVFDLTVNSDECAEPVIPDTSVYVHIYKYLLEGDYVSMIPNDSEITYQFPMQSTWDASNIGAGSGNYVLGASYPGSARYSATTSPMTAPADYMTNEITTDESWSSNVMPIDSESCPSGKWRLVGYKTGITLAAAEAAPISTIAPVFTDLIADRHVIVVNEECPFVEPDPTLKVHIYKYLEGDETEQVPDEFEPATTFPMQASWDAENIGAGSGAYVLGNNHGGATLKYAADTSAMTLGADYSTYEVTNDIDDESNVLSSEQSCQVGYYKHVGYKTSETSLEDAEEAYITTATPSFEDLESDAYVIVVNKYCGDEPEVTYADEVKMCKVDQNDEALSGWTLYLKGDTVETLNVNANSWMGADSSVLDDYTSYLALASGTWANQGGANMVDAEYSTTDSWTSYMDGYTGYGNDILDLQFNEGFINWGSYDNGHTYVYGFTPVIDDSVNFRVFDGTGGVQNEGWFNDNTGSLTVEIAKGFIGVTEEETGCVTFENVPVGEYTVGEIQQDGWTNVNEEDDGAVAIGETVVVTGNAEADIFTLINNNGEEEPVYGSITIVKLSEGGEGEFTFQSETLGDFEDFTLATSDGEDSITFENLLSGTYDVAEIPQDGWNLSDTTCTDGSSVDAIILSEGEDVTCTFTNVADEEEEDQQEEGGNGGGPIETFSGGGGGNGPVVGSFGQVLGASTGQVLGASTGLPELPKGCSALVSTYMRRGMNNDPEQVKLLQSFLNGELGLNVPVTGFFGILTENAVKAFQLKYAEQILAPWGITQPTGYVYKTTQRWINLSHCSTLNIPMPDLSN